MILVILSEVKVKVLITVRILEPRKAKMDLPVQPKAICLEEAPMANKAMGLALVP